MATKKMIVHLCAGCVRELDYIYPYVCAVNIYVVPEEICDNTTDDEGIMNSEKHETRYELDLVSTNRIIKLDTAETKVIVDRFRKGLYNVENNHGTN